MPLPDDLKYSSKQQHGLRPLLSAHLSALDMTSPPRKGLLNSNRQPVNGSTGWVGLLTLGAGEAATRTSHLPFPAALSPRRGWVPSAAKQQKVPESQGYFWDSWKLVPGPGLRELGESGLWWFCSVCRSRISSELRTPSPPSSHRLESTTGKGGNTEKGDTQGVWVKTPGPEDGRYTDPPQPPPPPTPAPCSTQQSAAQFNPRRHPGCSNCRGLLTISLDFLQGSPHTKSVGDSAQWNMASVPPPTAPAHPPWRPELRAIKEVSPPLQGDSTAALT